MQATLRSLPKNASCSLRVVLVLAPVLFSVFPVVPALAQAGEQALNPAAARISDQAIGADYQTYQALEARLVALNAKGRALSDSGMAKAQCWLDVSFHEYTRNDRSQFPDEALAESERLITLMEAPNPSGIPTETPLIGASTRLREDLWQKLEHLRQGSAGLCAQSRVACAEVELTHAAHEYEQGGWRHAKPYVEMAEDQTGAAEALAANCPVPQPLRPPGPSPLPTEQVTSEHIMSEHFSFAADALFAFGRSDLGALLPLGRALLDQLVTRVVQANAKVTRLQVTGHADRLGKSAAANQRLSEARARTVSAYLAAQGLIAQELVLAGSGTQEPLVDCQEGRYPDLVARRACLAPNRRVDVYVDAIFKKN